MSESESSSGGFVSSLKRIVATGLETAQDRIELFGVELRAEQFRLVEAILLAATLVAVGMLTVTLLTLLVVIYFWESGRLPAIGCLIVVYGLTGFLVWKRLNRCLTGTAPFSATLNELQKDRECLGIKK